MKTLTRVALISLVSLTLGCIDTMPLGPGITIEDTIDLGKVSESTQIEKVSSTVISDKLDVSFKLTSGARYSAQLIDIKGDVVDTHGFTATNINETRTFDYSKIKNGSYDFTLTDTQGKTVKVPVIITH